MTTSQKSSSKVGRETHSEFGGGLTIPIRLEHEMCTTRRLSPMTELRQA